MNRVSITVAGLILGLVATLSQAQQPQRRQMPSAPQPDSLAGQYYIGVTGSQFEYREIDDENLTTGAAGILFGKYLNDFIKFETRSGFGLGSDSPQQDLNAEVDFYASAYMGVYYQWSRFSQLYAQAGVSHVRASASGSDLDAFEDIDSDLLDNSFSPSFLVGLSVDVGWSSALFLEAGRLHSDPAARSGIDIWHYNTGLRYTF